MNDKPSTKTSAIRIKQQRIPIIGTLYDVFIMTTPLMSPVSYLLLSSTAYAVTRDYLLQAVPWLNYIVFLCLLVGLYLLGMLIVYKFMYASYFAHRNDQEYRHSNPLRRDIAANAKKLAELEKLLREILEQEKSDVASK